jgi:1-acyl-sn-glycerol-3-phosphate acyltransferase
VRTPIGARTCDRSFMDGAVRGTAALERRDPEYIRATLPTFAAFCERYHTLSVTGWEHLPDGPALIVGNHNGGTMAPDMFALMTAYWRRFDAASEAYGLMHDLMFRLPVVGDTMAKLGAVPARPENAVALLARGARVLVYPGGDLDAFKPSARRHEIIFGKRLGFIRIALRTGVPIVPVVSVGAHEGFHVLTDGAEFARRSGWKALTRVEVFPVILALPFGVAVGPVAAYVPLPVHMKLRVLDEIRWPDLPPEAAADDDVVRRCQAQVRDAMQRALDEMVAEGGFGRRLPWSRFAGRAPVR